MAKASKKSAKKPAAKPAAKGKKIVKAKAAPKKADKKAKPAPKPTKKAAPKAKKVVAPKKEAPKKVAKAVAKPVEKVEKEKKPLTRKQEALAKPLTAPQLTIFPALTQRPVAHKPQKATIQDDRTRYSEDELKEFEALILDKLEKAREEFRILKDTLNRTNDEGTDSTSGGNTKVLEDGAETAEKENLSQLAARQLKYMQNLENALVRIKNGTYGICSVTGKLISKERLIAVPHTTQSIEAKMMKQD